MTAAWAAVWVYTSFLLVVLGLVFMCVFDTESVCMLSAAVLLVVLRLSVCLSVCYLVYPNLLSTMTAVITGAFNTPLSLGDES